MSVIQRTVEQVLKQHAQTLEQALEKILAPGSRFVIGDLMRLEDTPRDGKTLQRSAICHTPSGFILYAVETTMDDAGFHSRGWIPEEGRLPWVGDFAPPRP